MQTGQGIRAIPTTLLPRGFMVFWTVVKTGAAKIVWIAVDREHGSPGTLTPAKSELQPILVTCDGVLSALELAEIT
jgi:hypothetical protein